MFYSSADWQKNARGIQHFGFEHKIFIDFFRLTFIKSKPLLDWESLRITDMP